MEAVRPPSRFSGGKAAGLRFSVPGRTGYPVDRRKRKRSMIAPVPKFLALRKRQSTGKRDRRVEDDPAKLWNRRFRQKQENFALLKKKYMDPFGVHSLRISAQN
jgi:hypothetical protein